MVNYLPESAKKREEKKKGPSLKRKRGDKPSLVPEIKRSLPSLPFYIILSFLLSLFIEHDNLGFGVQVYENINNSQNLVLETSINGYTETVRQLDLDLYFSNGGDTFSVALERALANPFMVDGGVGVDTEGLITALEGILSEAEVREAIESLSYPSDLNLTELVDFTDAEIMAQFLQNLTEEQLVRLLASALAAMNPDDSVVAVDLYNGYQAGKYGAEAFFPGISEFTTDELSLKYDLSEYFESRPNLWFLTAAIQSDQIQRNLYLLIQAALESRSSNPDLEKMRVILNQIDHEPIGQIQTYPDFQEYFEITPRDRILEAVGDDYRSAVNMARILASQGQYSQAEYMLSWFLNRLEMFTASQNIDDFAQMLGVDFDTLDSGQLNNAVGGRLRQSPDHKRVNAEAVEYALQHVSSDLQDMDDSLSNVYNQLITALQLRGEYSNANDANLREVINYLRAQRLDVIHISRELDTVSLQVGSILSTIQSYLESLDASGEAGIDPRISITELDNILSDMQYMLSFQSPLWSPVDPNGAFQETEFLDEMLERILSNWFYTSILSILLILGHSVVRYLLARRRGDVISGYFEDIQDFVSQVQKLIYQHTTSSINPEEAVREAQNLLNVMKQWQSQSSGSDGALEKAQKALLKLVDQSGGDDDENPQQAPQNTRQARLQ